MSSEAKHREDSWWDIGWLIGFALIVFVAAGLVIAEFT